MATLARKPLRRGTSVRSSGSAIARVTEAAVAFRMGLPVLIRDKHSTVLAFAVETLDDSALANLKRGAHLVLTHPRARTLKIRLYTPQVIAIAVEPGKDAEALRAIADPTSDLAEPLKGPFAAVRGDLPAGYAASVRLAKLSGLLPATVVKRARRANAALPSVSVDELAKYDHEILESLKIVTRARVPLAGAEKTELVAFRAKDGSPEHYAVLIGRPPPHDAVLARIHSECFTGDFLASLKCDCGSQLRGAIEAISKSGGGILLYLAQEGRGIGLINKLRAYRLQDQGFDTMEANNRLGFEADERLYGIAARMLSLLGYRSIRLLTNNPAKLDAVRRTGIAVVERVPHRFADNIHNRDYLRSKAKAGHLL